MMVENFEILLVIGIISVQVYLFYTTYKQIISFRNIIPGLDALKVSKILLPVYDLENLTPKQILDKVDSYKNAQSKLNSTLQLSEDDELITVEKSDTNIDLTEVTIIEKSNVLYTTDNPVLDKILFSINNYLLRNRGAASDFNLIKDIIQRNTDAVEEDINLSIGIPLYLGLMGTMVGIVIGLFNMPDLAAVFDTKEKDILLNEGIGLLIGGVKIAMIASFIGLLLTIINTGWFYKGARSYCESKKNDLYTFIQIELLPVINQGLASTFESLQRNLIKFNSEFSTNLKGLKGIFDSSRNAIKEQKELLDAINNAKVSDITNYNIAVLKQLDVSVGHFEKFNSNLFNVNLFVENSNHLISKSNELLERTNNFKNIAENIENKLDQSQTLMEFLTSHFNKLNEHKDFTSRAVADVSHFTTDALNELKTIILNTSDSVKQFTVDETDLLKKALSESKTNLVNLEHLSSLKTDVSQFKTSAASQGERLKQSIDELNKNMTRSISVLKHIEESSLSYKVNELVKSIKGIFKSKK